ncbi:MAG TPA: phytoene dehydrogenase, partial [Exiguobacterium sp.]|nr:phytoene dehydrogenase [Exiguobacterium sp.]
LTKQLGIEVTWLDFSASRAKYEFSGHTTAVPANAWGLLKTEVIEGTNKVRFTWEIIKTILRVERGNPQQSIGQWLKTERVDEQVAQLMLDLASTNFFTAEPEKIPSDVYFEYYQKLFRTRKPVSYIEGGWQGLVQELERIILENRGEILKKTKITAVELTTTGFLVRDRKKQEWNVERIIFAVPPREILKMATPTTIQKFVTPHASHKPVEVFVYDLGLQPYIQTPYSYIYDRSHRAFITDLSHYDASLAPKDGQVLQAIAYLEHDRLEDPDYIGHVRKGIEQMLDVHFTDWRERIVAERTIKRAVVQEIKWKMGQGPLATQIPGHAGVAFVGDWCEGTGQLSELAFSSAVSVFNRWT